MLIKIYLPLFLLMTITAKSQFKNDNVLYKTVDLSDLCTSLEKNKGWLILDVRSPGEYADTSAFPSYNLGHLKGARNINISELGKRLSEIQDYKDQPVYVYCSHSQRSRRAGKMLADWLYKYYQYKWWGDSHSLFRRKEKGCLKDLLQTGNAYSIISFKELCGWMGKDNGPLVIDVRSDSAFRHISMDAKINALGTIKNSVNIPLEKISSGQADIPRGRDIVLVDIFGDEASKAAVILKKNGYKNVSVLIEGIDRILYTDSKNASCRGAFYTSPVSYQTITVGEYGEYSKTNKEYILLDVRTTDEFANKHKDYWRNIGHITGAINIPVAEIGSRYNELDKNKEILIYAFGSGKEPFEAANTLQKNGFTKLKVVYGGVFNMRWTAGNVKDKSYLKELVVDIPESNQ